MRELNFVEIVKRIEHLAKLNGESKLYLAENVLFKSRQIFTDAKHHCFITTDLCKIAEHYGVTIDYLLYGDGNINFMPEDMSDVFIRLKKMTPEQRHPIISIIEGQIDYWKKVFNDDTK